ncbi:MAG: hypothetical protein JSS43_14975 [Proteobacteria bacterium]|nr:hypothetical protein [Pseudomonadota bacterium]
MHLFAMPKPRSLVYLDVANFMLLCIAVCLVVLVVAVVVHTAPPGPTGG